MTTDPDQTNDPLAAAERRSARLETELDITRQRLATKERELEDIHRSRAWGLVTALRSLKHRIVDPLLGRAGIVWPPRRAASPPVASDVPIPPPRPGKYDIVCFSICDWDSRVQRPQQLLSLFAAAGHRVFYVSQQFRRGGPSWAFTETQSNVFEITLRGEALNVYAHRLDGRARELLWRGLDDLRRDAALGDAAIFVHLPFWWPLARQARERFGWPVLYDCMDHHAGFATVRQAMVAQECDLLAEADVVITSSATLEQRALKKRDQVLLLRNGCDFAHFVKTPTARNERPLIGYYGAIADWFDSALVADLARRRPEWDFLLIGSTYGADVARLARLPNVSLPGEEPYASLPECLGRFDVAIIPFKRTSVTEATNPVKMYEMLAGGKPIVSVPIPEAAALAPLVRLASGAEEFEREIAAALASGDAGIEERRAFARANQWQQRFEVLEAATAAAVARVLL